MKSQNIQAWSSPVSFWPCHLLASLLCSVSDSVWTSEHESWPHFSVSWGVSSSLEHASSAFHLPWQSYFSSFVQLPVQNKINNSCTNISSQHTTSINNTAAWHCVWWIKIICIKYWQRKSFASQTKNIIFINIHF